MAMTPGLGVCELSIWKPALSASGSKRHYEIPGWAGAGCRDRRKGWPLAGASRAWLWATARVLEYGQSGSSHWRMVMRTDAHWPCVSCQQTPPTGPLGPSHQGCTGKVRVPPRASKNHFSDTVTAWAILHPWHPGGEVQGETGRVSVTTLW